jgi:hypothetical protein
MKLNLNGVEIDLPNNAKVDVSKDGKSVKIELPEAEVVEKIRLVEVPGEEKVVERIQVIEKYLPCTLQHYPTYPSYPNPWITYTTGGTQIQQSPNTITYGTTSGGIPSADAGQMSGQVISCGNTNITCNNPNWLTGTADVSSNITYTSTN